MWNLKKYCLIFILIFTNLWSCRVLCFHVNFRERYDGSVEPFTTQIYKREMAQFFDKASYSFNGFEKVISIPVLFPIDICLLTVESVKYATSVHANKSGLRHFAVFKINNGTYELIADIPTPDAIAMDCRTIGAKGYAAIAFNITAPIENAKEGSPIYEITGNRVRGVQYFATPNMVNIYLRVTGNDLFLLQTFANTKAMPNLQCPYFKWSGTTFTKLGHIPCSNARQLEPFSIDYESYVAVANFADQRGRTATNSEIYKYVREKKKFQLFQKIRTNGAVDVRHFTVPFDEIKKQHFLVFGNSISAVAVNKPNKTKREEEKNLEADTVFYVFERGQFVPYQRLSFYDVRQFLPVQNSDAEKFLLLVACNNQDIKIYNLNDWKFEESTAQFTEGALGRGVSNMRIFQEQDNSYLVIANALMAENETNVFLPIFKQDEHANALRQEIIEWAQSNMERLGKIDVAKLKQDVEAKLAKTQQSKVTAEVNDIPSSNIETVITQSLVYPRLHLSTNYWKALSYANQALDVLELQLAPKQLQKREVETRKRLNKTDYEFERANVGTLVVRDQLKATRVNGIEVAAPKFKSISAKKVIVTGSYKAPVAAERERLPNVGDEQPERNVINVENLRISGKLNEHTWENLIDNTLKRAGQQFVKSPAEFTTLQADSVVVTNEKVNERHLSTLIPITGGSYVVNQDVQFAAPVTANNLMINDRLNNLYILQHKFDVLLKRSNTTQVIKGAKRLQNVRVLEPITIAGQMLGDHLQSISPTKAIHDTLILHGDYIINGNVTIAKELKASDIVVPNLLITTKQALQNGLRLDGTVDDVNIKFGEPIVANNSHVTFINAHDFQQLIQTNIDQIQVVEGEKDFLDSLEIRQGFSEVKILNGIDVEKLEQRLLLKHTNQTIKEAMHFSKILARGVSAESLILNNKNLSHYLTKSGSQHIPGTLKVDKLNAQNLNLENLNINGKIFNAQLVDIYQQKAKNTPSADIFQKNRKYLGSIYVKNLKTNSTINGRALNEIVTQLAELDRNIKYVGNYVFNYDMNITNLTFYGHFNGIPAKDFGRCWLQKTGRQSFTAPQTLAEANCKEGVILEGKLNGYKIEELCENTYWINHDEVFNTTVFQNPIQMQDVLFTETLNGLRIPQDILYRNAAEPQVLYANLIVNNDLNVDGRILKTTTVNGINLSKLERFLSGSNDGFETLHVQQANFPHAPYYKTLNKHDLRNTLNEVWLANENVALQQHVEISEGYFDGLLEFEGPINNVNLRYLKENCFSMSRTQEVAAELVFTSDATFENDVDIEAMKVYGPVIDSKSNSEFDFNEFVSNTLKTAGPHTISGSWHISNAVVHGDLSHVQVNDLNLVDDVIRTDMPINEVTAEKRIDGAVIEKLYAPPTSVINGISVANWIQDAVYVYENHTIKGTTTLDAVNLYKDLIVLGNINNITFDEHTLLLRDRDQTIHGNLIVHNHAPQESQSLTNNFENLHAERINGKSVDSFLANRAKMTTPTVNVQSHVTFTQPLLVNEYHGSGMFFDEKKQRRDSGYDSLENWNTLKNAVQKLRNSFEVSHYILSHFEVKQTIEINTTNLIPLSLRINEDFLDVIGFMKEEEISKFYRWDPKTQQFILEEKLSFLPRENVLVEILKLTFKNVDYITVQQAHQDTFHQNIISSKTEGLMQLLDKTQQNEQIESFEMRGEDCFAVFGNASEEVLIYCLLLQPNIKLYQRSVIKRGNVKQILPLSVETIALRLSDAVEIWNTTGVNLQLQQRIPIVHPKQMAVSARSRGDGNYLALISDLKPNTLHHGAIEIYSSKNGSQYELMQTLDCIEPQQVAFTALGQSNDLLLHVLTATADQSLMIYQYKGVVGFEKIVGPSTLPRATQMQLIELKSSNQHIIALLGSRETTFVEIVVKKV